MTFHSLKITGYNGNTPTLYTNIPGTWTEVTVNVYKQTFGIFNKLTIQINEPDLTRWEAATMLREKLKFYFEIHTLTHRS